MHYYVWKKLKWIEVSEEEYKRHTELKMTTSRELKSNEVDDFRVALHNI